MLYHDIFALSLYLAPQEKALLRVCETKSAEMYKLCDISAGFFIETSNTMHRDSLKCIWLYINYIYIYIHVYRFTYLYMYIFIQLYLVINRPI